MIQRFFSLTSTPTQKGAEHGPVAQKNTILNFSHQVMGFDCEWPYAGNTSFVLTSGDVANTRNDVIVVNSVRGFLESVTGTKSATNAAAARR